MKRTRVRKSNKKTIIITSKEIKNLPIKILILDSNPILNMKYEMRIIHRDDYMVGISLPILLQNASHLIIIKIALLLQLIYMNMYLHYV